MRFEQRTPQLRLKLEGWRSRFVLVLAILGFAVLAGRAFFLQGMDHGFLQAKGEARYARAIDMPASRGAVLDRHGHPLAISTPVESIWVAPEDVEAEPAQVKALAHALDMDARDIRQKIASKDRQFVYLKRQIAPDRAAKVMAMRIPGVFEQREYRRYYPAGAVMAHVVGFTGVDDNGQEGVELAEQDRLAGTPGSRREIRDRKGRIVEDVESVRPPRDGEDVVLAVDERLQFLAHRSLKAAVAEHHAKGGSLVILDARTGEILALVNMPDFNPNNRASLTPAQSRNRSVTDLFEPGSTMKPFTIALALDAGIVTPSTVIDTAPGWMRIGGWPIHDSHPHGLLTVSQVIQKSSNVGTAKIVLRMPPEKVGAFLHDLGFGVAPRIGFPGAAKGLLRPASEWRPVEQATIGYGQGIGVSLLQLARAYTVFANDGQLLPLSLLKRDSRPIGKQVLSARTARQVTRMMEMVVDAGGTAPLAQVPGYRVAGKTGTALKPENGRYAEGKYVSSFVGFGPVSDPRFVVAVMIDEPEGVRNFGGDVAAPVFASVMGSALRLISVPPDAPQTLDARALQRAEAEPRAAAPGSAG
jgi:cell division protein FtsI (penicillin-binding protein 3)